MAVDCHANDEDCGTIARSHPDALVSISFRGSFAGSRHREEVRTSSAPVKSGSVLGSKRGSFLMSAEGVVGVYGVIAYSVSQRTREIGTSMAVGAETSSVYRLILTEAGWLTVVGIALGLMGSLGTARLMRDLLFGVARGTSQHSCRSRCYWGAQRCLQASFPPAAPPQ